MDEIMSSIKELRQTLDSKINDCLTKDKAEKMIEDIITNLHPQQSKAVLPATPEDVLDRFSAFTKSGRNMPERPWTSEYGRKFGNMKNFLLAAKNNHSLLNDFKAVIPKYSPHGQAEISSFNFAL